MQWLRRTPALWLVLAVELLMVGQAVWAALQPPVSGVWTIDQYQQLLPEQTQLDEQGRLSVQLTEYGGKDILLSPVVALTPGHYQFTVSYESRPTFEADGRVNHASLSLHSLDNNMAVRDEWAALSFHRKEQTVTLTVRQPSDAVQMTVYNGGGYLEVGEFTRDNGVTTVLCASQRDSEGYVEMPLLYYPGYTVVDGPGATYLTVNGMVGVTVPAGYAGTISVAFREPKRWLLADGVSLVTLLGMIGWSPWKKRRAVSKK